MVLAVGLMVACALPEKVADPASTRRQNQTVADPPYEACLSGAKDETLIKDFTVLPSRLAGLRPGDPD